MRNWTAIALCAVVVAACTPSEDQVLFDGQSYKSKLRKIDRQRDQFTVTVAPVSKSLLGAREAGRYEAVVHCVNEYGSSDIIWAAGPDAPQAQLRIDKDTLTLQGRCPNAR